MPLYRYQCGACGLQFEAAAKLTDYKAPQPCKACGKPAQRLLPENVQGVFEQPVTGPVPQNTGVAELDAHIDRVIGKSSQQGWGAHTARVEDKRDALRQTGATGYDLSRTRDGKWRVMKPEERRASEVARALTGAPVAAGQEKGSSAVR